MIHVLVGQESFVEQFNHGATAGDPVSWIVPKKAEPGDDVLLFFPHAGFLGHGEIVSEPEPATFGHRRGYGAEVRIITRYPSAVTLDVVTKQFPEWAWATYPRSFTTPPPALAGRILDFVQQCGRAGAGGARRTRPSAPVK